MSKLINQNFLTLPQQVGKNKKDIESLESRVGGISVEVDKLVVGELVVQILNPNTPIVIENYGINVMPNGVNSSLLDYIINNMMLTDKKEPLYVNLKVMGGFVPNVSSPTDYTVIFTTTTIEKLDTNEWLFRAVGYSQDVRFEIYAEYTYYADEYRFISQPEIIMVSLISNSVFYTQPGKIVGGVVNRDDLSPNTTLIPPQKGDMVIAGTGVYTIGSIVGTNVNLMTQTGFIAPSGTLISTRLILDNDSPDETDKRNLNTVVGLPIFNTAENSLEDKLLGQGLELAVNAFLAYSYIGLMSAPAYISRTNGLLFYGIKNNSGADVTITDMSWLADMNGDRNNGYLYRTHVGASADIKPSLVPINGDLTNGIYLNNLANGLNNKTIKNGEQFIFSIYL